MKVTLNKEEMAELNKFNTLRRGGFQDFFRMLQNRSHAGAGTMELTLEDRERIARYAFEYGNGGWETRLVKTFGRHLGPNLGRELLPKAPQQTELI